MTAHLFTNPVFRPLTISGAGRIYMTAEIWKPVLGFEGLYEVSDRGRVRSLCRNTRSGVRGGRLLRPQPDVSGHRRVTLYRNGRPERRFVHVAVLEAFVGPRPLQSMEALHGNGTPSDNFVANLRWGSRAENAQDRLAHGRQVDNRGSRHGNAKLNETDVERIRDMRRTGCTQQQVAEWLEVSFSLISGIERGARWRHVGAAE